MKTEYVFGLCKLMHCVCLSLNKEILSDQQNDGADALHHASPGQPSLPEISPQPPLPETSAQSPIMLFSTEPPLPVITSQPPLTVLSHQEETLISDDEEPLTPSSVLEPVIVLDEQDEPVLQNLSPVSLHHLRGPVDEYEFSH